MNFICNKCSKIYPINGLSFKCSCGGLFKLKKKQMKNLKILYHWEK